MEWVSPVGYQRLQYELSYLEEYPAGNDSISPSFINMMEASDNVVVDECPPGDEELDDSTLPVDRDRDSTPPPPWIPEGGWDLSLLREAYRERQRPWSSTPVVESEVAALLELEEWLYQAEGVSPRPSSDTTGRGEDCSSSA